jgi:hypothetical protein
MAGLLLLAGTAQAAPPRVHLVPHRTTCVAPCDVFFDARATQDPDHDQDWKDLIDLTYAWSFGDPESGFWRHGASKHSRDIDTGFVAGHVYETPGRYKVTLRVTDQQGESATAETQIRVRDPAEMWPGERTVCVRADESKSFKGCPKGARQVTTDSFDEALRSSGFCNLDDISGRCLFRRGDSFQTSSPTDPASGRSHLVGAFGRGAKPRVVLDAGKRSVFRPAQRATNARVILMDLEVVGTDHKAQRFFDLNHRVAQNILILRVDMKDLATSIMLYAGSKRFVPGMQMPNHISIVDSTSVSNSPTAAIVYSSVEQFLMLGNDFGDRDGQQHVVRIGWTHGGVVAHNSLGRHCGETHHVLKIHNHKDKETSACTREFIVADNLIEACGTNRSDVTIQPNSNRGQECVERFVVERNLFRKRNTDYASHRSLSVSGHAAAVRSNIFDLSGAKQVRTPRGVVVKQQTTSQVDYVMPRDIRIWNNTCYVDAKTLGKGRCIQVESAATNVDVRNNLLYDAAGRSELIHNESTSTTFCAEGEGTGECNVITRKTPFISTRPYELGAFAPKRGAVSVGAGEALLRVPINLERTDAALRGGANTATTDLGAFDAGTPPANAEGSASETQ